MLDQKYQDRLDKWRKKEPPIEKAKEPKPKFYVARRDYGDVLPELEKKNNLPRGER